MECRDYPNQVRVLKGDSEVAVVAPGQKDGWLAPVFERRNELVAVTYRDADVVSEEVIVAETAPLPAIA